MRMEHSLERPTMDSVCRISIFSPARAPRRMRRLACSPSRMPRLSSKFAQRSRNDRSGAKRQVAGGVVQRVLEFRPRLERVFGFLCCRHHCSLFMPIFTACNECARLLPARPERRLRVDRKCLACGAGSGELQENKTADSGRPAV